MTSTYILEEEMYSKDDKQSTLKMEESMAEIKSCKFPEFKGTRFVLFWEIVQFTEERCTHLERRQFGLEKRRRDLNSLFNGHIRIEEGRTLEDEAVDNHSREELIVVSTAESSLAHLGAFP
ncbi:hypothetical protein F511_04276 [Dorcoceras hygrometricum]|uniref:Uncharacterized protein n=1 Tax=Dorcoceras hygrometricum TaxID=472368 RepID=A0A2Z7BVG6_9LAMI|nr:hypothetical protein F511_04276 [Dorcoceras hygrometricum]